jgi:hypothetical protein
MKPFLATIFFYLVHYNSLFGQTAKEQTATATEDGIMKIDRPYRRGIDNIRPYGQTFRYGGRENRTVGYARNIGNYTHIQSTVTSNPTVTDAPAAKSGRANPSCGR